MRFVQFLAEIYFNLKQVYQIHENRGTKISYRDGKRTTISWKISSTLDKRITLGGGRNLRRERVTRLLNWPLIMQIERLPRSRVLAQLAVRTVCNHFYPRRWEVFEKKRRDGRFSIEDSYPRTGMERKKPLSIEKECILSISLGPVHFLPCLPPEFSPPLLFRTVH